MNPQFPVLLDIAATFGPDRLEREWSVLCADAETETGSIEVGVSRMLANIRRGYEQASA